jgi:hypothetical protein
MKLAAERPRGKGLDRDPALFMIPLISKLQGAVSEGVAIDRLTHT